MRTWTFAEARPPGEPGPWTDEPDKAQWVDEATGLDCLIVRGPITGALCGYVGVPPGHPFHGQSHHDGEPMADAISDLHVHGGINFTSFCQEGAEDGYAVCHVPEPGRPERVWWLGFDCGHAFDYSPWLRALSRRFSPDLYPPYNHEAAVLATGLREIYRTFDYVRGQVAHLAHQVQEAANSASSAIICAGVDAAR